MEVIVTSALQYPNDTLIVTGTVNDVEYKANGWFSHYEKLKTPKEQKAYVIQLLLEQANIHNPVAIEILDNPIKAKVKV